MFWVKCCCKVSRLYIYVVLASALAYGLFAGALYQTLVKGTESDGSLTYQLCFAGCNPHLTS